MTTPIHPEETSQIALNLPEPPAVEAASAPAQNGTMHVRKRNGTFESVDVNKIVRAVARCCVGLKSVEVYLRNAFLRRMQTPSVTRPASSMA